MDALLLNIYLATFSLGILLSALLIFVDIRRHQKRHIIVLPDHPWTTAAAFVFDLIQACLSVAGVVGASIALSSPPDRIEDLWQDAVVTCNLQLLVGNYSTHLLRLFQYPHWVLLGSYTMTMLSMLSMLSTYLIAYIANTKTNVSAAKSFCLLSLAVVSFLTAEVTRRALQNHRYAAGLSRPTREERNDRCNVLRFLVTSTKLSFLASFVHIGGAR
ncbi:hypothetical protein E8E12_000754 [Didymella heteroderae]|uniref:Uncharacterized protein n=1 Tax=Didymella heteroderae TaxID=1769908 RepID=A0A9P5BVQ0_9PLEO|nr:hypothetical protein E8E12_000754 [Didymella heteroderae]